MKRMLSILVLTAFPLTVFAAGDHADGHGAHEAQAPMSHDHDAMGGDGKRDDVHDQRMSEHMSHDHEAMSGDAGGRRVGQPGDPARINRVIDVAMDDNMRFAPRTITVKAGETVRFFVRNHGKLQHEMVIGPMADLKAHADMMRKQPHMSHVEPNMTSLKPGQRGGIVWRFDRPGSVDFACLVPGHLEAGMLGNIIIE